MSATTKNVSGLKFFSTGHIAKICGVSIATVNLWLDAGEMEFFLMPGTAERRVPRKNLIAFLKKYGIPMDELYGNGSLNVLVATNDESLTKKVGKAAKKLKCDLLVVDDGAEALLQAGLSRPDVFIFDAHLPGIGGIDAVKNMTRSGALANTKIAVASDLPGKEAGPLKKSGVTVIGSKPKLEVVEDLLTS